ncbi:MAG: hypothetical protein HYR60_11090 [Acidobacteria bacterium]|nr:hypothetical protein [Acidobacteriota bacterium]
MGNRRCLAILGLALAAWAQAPVKKWRDLGEHKLFTSIAGEPDPQRRLALLDLWNTQYPVSDFKKERLHLYIATCQGVGRSASAFDFARQLLEIDAGDPTGLYWATLLAPSQMETKKADLETAEQWANRLLAASKPAASAADGDAVAHKTLGWAAMQRGEHPKAEAAFVESLKRKPDAAQVSLWLGTVIEAQQNPERQADALFHLARAASLTGTGGLPPDERVYANVLFNKAYTKYRGEEHAGMAELREQAKLHALPPVGFQLPKGAVSRKGAKDAK